MTSQLFTLVHGLDTRIVDGVVPPACRTHAVLARAPVAGRGEAVLTAEWRTGAGGRRFVPSLAALTPSRVAFRFELSVGTADGWSPWAAAAPIGDAPFTPAPAPAPPLGCDVDVFTSDVPVDRVRLRLRVHGAAVSAMQAAPWLVALSVSDDAPPTPGGRDTVRARLPVPARTQMVEAEPIRMRICSPTSVAMVLEHWGRRVDTAVVAADVFHPALDLYGVWPSAVAAAAKRGVAGYLLRFPDWASAAWCLGAGLPVVASVRYTAGELEGAAMPATTGHLVVLTGCDGDDVWINDPAAPTVDAVPRRVRRDALERAWLGGTGIGYVLFDPHRPPTTPA